MLLSCAAEHLSESENEHRKAANQHRETAKNERHCVGQGYVIQVPCIHKHTHDLLVVLPSTCNTAYNNFIRNSNYQLTCNNRADYCANCIADKNDSHTDRQKTEIVIKRTQ